MLDSSETVKDSSEALVEIVEGAKVFIVNGNLSALGTNSDGVKLLQLTVNGFVIYWVLNGLDAASTIGLKV